MAEEDDFPVSTVNINASPLMQEDLDDFDHDGLLIFEGVEEPRDVVVLVNRIVDTFKYVTAMSLYSDGFLMVKYKRY